MGFASSYLRKHAFYDTFIPYPPREDTGIIVVIPCYNEPGVLRSVISLAEASLPSYPVEVIVAVNAPENAPEGVFEQNRRTLEQLNEWCRANNRDGFAVYPVDVPPLPARHAGAGFARKAGMDEAVRRFSMTGNMRGVIVSFDADSLCENNYFTELESCFDGGGIIGCTICFEHPVEDHNGDRPGGIVDYELYLRYYIQAMRHAGFPWAFHTIGSCFAVNARVYADQGGMNRRKAGEDFYFLHKIFPLGRFTELNTTMVMPSSRVSDRVPFGTGATLKKLSSIGGEPLMTWPPHSFDDLGVLFGSLPGLFKVADSEIARVSAAFPELLRRYLEENRFAYNMMQINMNSASFPAFKKRFFRWFGGLMILRYLNFARRNGRENIPVTGASAGLLDRLGVQGATSNTELLGIYRKLQRETVWRC